MITIKAENISKCFKLSTAQRPLNNLLKKKKTSHEFKALHDVSFSIKQGESIAIIGCNGSGKSTLLQIIAQIIKPTTGKLTVNGRIAALLELGSGFSPEFTGAENIQINGLLLGLSPKEIEQKFSSIVKFADIGEFIDHKVKTYSSGMVLRLAFAVMLHVDPDILIIDEALAVGDIFFQQKCMRHLQEHFATKTKIFVTHDMGAVASLCTRVLYLERGALKFDGATARGIEYYIKDSQSHERPPLPATTMPDLLKEQQWEMISAEQLSGLLEIKICGIKISVNNCPAAFPKTGIRAQDQVTLELLVCSTKMDATLVFGYLLSDKYGHYVFGENSCMDHKTHILPTPGYYTVHYQFVWPDVHQAQYTLTPGIGEGTHALNHQIQCWANNIFIFDCISPHPVHGLFNNPLTSFHITPLTKNEWDDSPLLIADEAVT